MIYLMLAVLCLALAAYVAFVAALTIGGYSIGNLLEILGRYQ